MANENVRKFEELLRSDEEIQAKLRAAADAYGGDKADEQAVFEATIGKVAAEAGLPFTLEEGRAIAVEGAELSDEDLEAVAGGALCYAFGGSSDVEVGSCQTDADFDGAGACAYLGATFQEW